MNATKSTFAAVLAEFAESFEVRTRNDGAKFTRLRDLRPEWIDSDVMHEIHEYLDDRMPDDWVYESVAAIADSLTGYNIDDADDARDYLGEIADSLVDVYNSDRLKWLASHLNNAFIVDDACEELGQAGDTFTRIGVGQYVALERLGAGVIAVCEAEADSRGEDEEEDDEE